MNEIEFLERKVDELHENVKEAETECQKQLFHLENVFDDDKKLKFHTGFASYSAVMVCFNLFGPAVDKLVYRSSSKSEQKSIKGH